MSKQYSVLLLTIAVLLAGCGIINPPAPTPQPYNKYTAQDVIRAFNAAGLSVINAQRDMLTGRDAPSSHSDRYTFEMEDLPIGSGGQILVFDSAEGQSEWQQWFDTLRSDPATRSSVIYVFSKDNIILQLNTALMPADANRYRDALNGMA